MERKTVFILKGTLRLGLGVFFECLLSLAQVSAQTNLVTGKVIDSNDKQPIPGVNVLLKGQSTVGTITDNNGTYSLNIPYDTGILIFSYIGYVSVQENIAGRKAININLTTQITGLNEVVVIGYGTQQKKDLTGALSSIQEVDFNKGNFTSPDQLIQGRAAGVQITTTSGQPGVAATIKIRGNSVMTGTGQPLFVIDGVPLSGLTARPNTNDNDGGSSPAGNPLNFINPADIASIDVLKDASATAIYGSRAAYGVINITTKKGLIGTPKIDFSSSMGLASIQHREAVLNAGQYRAAIKYYNVNPSNDKGGNSDGLGSILQKGIQQNYNLAISGGNKDNRYRFSMGYFDQQGILTTSEIKKYNSLFSGNYKFLESKRLGMDINLILSQYQEQIPLIRNSGSLVGDALNWNPTDSLRHRDGSLNLNPSSANNPLALSKLYNDQSKVTTLLTSVAPYYDLTDWLQFKTVVSVNYSTGIRRNSVAQGLFPNSGIPAGAANIYNTETSTSQLTSTLRFHKDIFQALNLNVIGGFEYMKFINKGFSVQALGPVNGFGNYGLDYTNYIQYSDPSKRNVSSYADPLSEIQSYFGRASLDFKKKYLLTATFRADGSTKFGANNKYGYFPSFSAAWVVSEEKTFKVEFIDFFKLRVGWGKTGNQEFPSGSSVALYGFTNNGGYGQINNPNPNLKWQSDQQLNAGADFGMFKNRLSLTLDYFDKITTDLLYPSYPIQPAPPGAAFTWINLDGKIRNRGLEITLKSSIVSYSSFSWDLAFNTTFIKNSVNGLTAPINTGWLDGSGLSDVTVQQIKSGAPMNSFYTRKYLGIDKSTGLSIYEDSGNTFYDVGNPNPNFLLGMSSTVRYKKISLTTYLYGAFGQSIYNNTALSTINIANFGGAKNIAQAVYTNPIKESVGNPVFASSRYIEKGDYLKMGSATISYRAGAIGKAFKQLQFYITGQNLFTITKYSGFDPEVNIDKSANGVPSLGIDYHSYPRARTVLIGINFSL